MDQYDIALAILQRQIEQEKLSPQKQLWAFNQVRKFLQILQIDNCLEKTLKNSEKILTGWKLFANLQGPQLLVQKFQSFISDLNFFPFYKFVLIVSMYVNKNHLENNEDLSPTRLKQKHRQQMDALNSLSSQNKQQIFNYSEQILMKMKELLQQFSEKSELSVIQLSTKEIYNIICNLGWNQHIQKISLIEVLAIISKYYIDGFTLVYTLSNELLLQLMKNYYNQNQIKWLKFLSGLFTLFHFKQLNKLNLFSQKRQSVYSAKLQKQQEQYQLKTIQLIQENSQSSDLQKSQTEININNIIAEAVQKQQQKNIRQSRRSKHSSVCYSEYGVSQYATSQMGSVVYATSEMNSELMNTYNQDFASTNPSSHHTQPYTSSIEEHELVKQLKNIAFNLQFNLLNLEPLRWIRITKLPTPFSIYLNQNEQKLHDKESKIFTLQGAKFGRQKQNDFCYPDELSISGKHAQIYFRGEDFYLKDMGSKTGTFLRIQEPLLLNDDVCLQLSYEVEMVIRILKKQQNEGVIKIQFNKPQNLSGYRASLKNGFLIKIGRSENCHIKIDPSKLSIAQKHAQIKYQNQNFYFSDRKSSSGSWLRLSARSVKSEGFKLKVNSIFRISSKRSYIIEEMKQLQK